jgi:hypothetical protein
MAHDIVDIYSAAVSAHPCITNMQAIFAERLTPCDIA